LLGIALLLAPTVVFIVARKSCSLMLFGWAAFLTMMLPFANIIPMAQIIGERFLYMATIGIAIVVTALFYMLLSIMSHPRTALLTGTFLLLILISADSLVIADRVHVWKNDLAFFRDIEQQNPKSRRASNNYLYALYSSGNTSATIEFARRIPERFPNARELRITAAQTLIVEGCTTEGLALIRQLGNSNAGAVAP
jgi:hypothetical protein